MAFDFDAVSDILACPQCHGKLVCIGDSLICNCGDQRLKFPVVDGIPRLLVDEATSLSDEEWEKLQAEQEPQK